jgi:AraC family transcriptional regulator
MPVLTDLHLSRYMARSRLAPHTHDVATLNIVMDGEFTELVAGQERRYARGTVSFCPAGEVHSQTFGNRGARQIIFRPQPEWIDYLRDARVDLAVSPYSCAPAFQALGARMQAEMSNDDTFSALACEGLMLELVAAFARSGARTAAACAPPAWLSRARTFIQEHACTPITLRRIAQAAGRHEIHLAREFRRHFGLSIGGYVRQLRTQEAMRLLMWSQRDIAEIALACGFSSHSHLCREFKARFGSTPSMYREHHV